MGEERDDYGMGVRTFKAKADISVSESSGSRNRSWKSHVDLPTQNRGNALRQVKRPAEEYDA